MVGYKWQENEDEDVSGCLLEHVIEGAIEGRI
jgi:hypothetical protein